MMVPMTVMSVRYDDEVVILVEGVLDGDLAPALHVEIEAAAAIPGCAVLIDLTGVTAVDDGGAAVLAAAAHRTTATGTMLTLHLPDGRLVEVNDAGAVRALLRPVEGG
jgi:anti-anti-sigma factor